MWKAFALRFAALEVNCAFPPHNPRIRGIIVECFEFEISHLILAVFWAFGVDGSVIVSKFSTVS